MFNWDENPDLNITPLVDVMLVLMAILMVTAPTVLYQEDISLPQGSQTKKVKKQESIDITLHKEGYILYNKEKIPFAEFADSFVLKAADLNKDTVVYISADERLQYKKVMDILRIVKQAGFSKASLVTNE